MRERLGAAVASYLLAVAAAAAAVGLRWFLDPILVDHTPLVTLFGAVAFAVWLGGYRSALVVMTLGYFACHYLFIEPRGSFSFDSARTVVGLLAYLVTCFIIIAFGEAMRAARRGVQEGREFLQVTFASIGDAVMTTDTKGSITYLNPVAESLTGWIQKDAVGQTLNAVFRIVNEQTREPVESPATRALREGLVVGLANHTILLRKDGTERPIDDSAAPIRDAEGRTLGVVLVFRDVTQRRQTERLQRDLHRQLEQQVQERTAQLRASEEKFRLLVEGTKDYAIFMLDPGGEIVSWTSGAERIKQYRAEEIVGQHFSRFYPAADVEAGKPQRELWIAEEEGKYEEEGWRVRRDGTQFWASVVITALRDDAGKVRGFSNVTRDITDKKQAEENARLLFGEETARQAAEKFAQVIEEQREKLRVTLASIGDAVMTTDAEGRVTMLNPIAEKLTGWTNEDAAGRPVQTIFRIINEITRQPVENPIAKVLATGHILGLANSTVLIAKDGTERPIDDSAAPIKDSQGEILGCVLIFRDITERRRTENALRRSEQELADFFENATVALHWVGPDGAILRANQTELDMLGYTREEYLGRHIAEFHADQSVIEDILERLTRGETLRDYPARMRRKDGSIRDVLISSNGLFEDGRFLHSRCFTRDITELKDAQRAQTLLAAIVESSDDAIVSKSLDGIIQSWNDGARRIFGHTAEQAVGRHISLIIPPERLKEEEQILARLRAGERVDHFETVRLRRDGRSCHVSLTISPIRDETGQVIGASKIARDITEQKQAEEELRAKDAELQLVTERTPLILTRCSRDLRYLFANRAAAALFGLTPQQMIGRPIIEIMGEQTFASIKPHVDRVLQGETVEYEAQIPYPGVGLRWVSVNYLPERDRQGGVVGWVASITDITDRKHYERELKEADQRKDVFLATLAHELRNPLAPIRNAVEILKMKSPPDPELQWSRDVIDRQVQQMSRLLDDLLDLSRISYNKLELRKQRIELSSVIQTAVETNRPHIDSAGHQLDLALPPEPVYLDADPVRLAQVFSNLINNAVKYAESGGHIQITCERQGSDVVVSVKDDGIGIDAEMLHRIFDMFSQGKGVLERSQEGLGIGLSLVQGLIELHGGSIEAHSDGPGKGSEFIVRLPLMTAPVQEPVGPGGEAEQTAATKFRFLIVDDIRDNADSLAMLLDIMGHEVHTAYDGEDAIVAAEKLEPDVILLDIGMPKLSGYDTCRRIREQPWGNDLLLIAVTGWGQESDRQRIEEAGFDHHLVKPVEPNTLMSLLQSPTRTRNISSQPPLR